jgi:hypothetical protein
MRSILLPLGLAVCLTTALASLGAPNDPNSPVRYAAPGDASRGEFVSETADELQVNITPCGSNRTIVIFRKPYDKQDAGSVKCGGAEKKLIQAVKR